MDFRRDHYPSGGSGGGGQEPSASYGGRREDPAASYSGRGDESGSGGDSYSYRREDPGGNDLHCSVYSKNVISCLAS